MVKPDDLSRGIGIIPGDGEPPSLDCQPRSLRKVSIHLAKFGKPLRRGAENALQRVRMLGVEVRACHVGAVNINADCRHLVLNHSRSVIGDLSSRNRKRSAPARHETMRLGSSDDENSRRRCPLTIKPSPCACARPLARGLKRRSELHMHGILRHLVGEKPHLKVEPSLVVLDKVDCDMDQPRPWAGSTRATLPQINGSEIEGRVGSPCSRS